MFFYGFRQRIACRKIQKRPEISPCDKDRPGSPIKDTAGPSTSASLPDIAAITEPDVIIYICSSDYQEDYYYNC
jgi:hypothetical protein